MLFALACACAFVCVCECVNSSKQTSRAFGHQHVEVGGDVWRNVKRWAERVGVPTTQCAHEVEASSKSLKNWRIDSTPPRLLPTKNILINKTTSCDCMRTARESSGRIHRTCPVHIKEGEAPKEDSEAARSSEPELTSRHRGCCPQPVRSAEIRVWEF